ncbi:hypothetical protein BS47DRAFT_541117 [Hydnum rufescens UP504]|uniref:Uncharacterized protein n=1 Tax=Hydnum rufescens UP504 TaxID=1448309 RepID=A0A9P6DX80_9AGAM|nr:hypothetical protein BS47DRAFT_541117 [Hydnum rufescens UP504]
MFVMVTQPANTSWALTLAICGSLLVRSHSQLALRTIASRALSVIDWDWTSRDDTPNHPVYSMALDGAVRSIPFMRISSLRGIIRHQCIRARRAQKRNYPISCLSSF